MPVSRDAQVVAAEKQQVCHSQARRPLVPSFAFDAVETYGITAIAIVAIGYFLGGFAKGVVGTALPLIAISISAIVLPAPIAVVLIAVPGVVTNIWQSLRQGPHLAIATARRFWIMLGMIMITIWFVTGFLPAINQQFLLLLIGCVTITFSAMQLFGWRLRLSARLERPIQFVGGLVGGITGGLSGVWGPPVLVVLLALELPKAEHVRAAGLCWSLGAMAFFLAHLRSGLLDGHTLPLSAAVALPAAAGIALGVRVQDRLEQETFRRITLVLLCGIGAALLWRAAG